MKNILPYLLGAIMFAGAIAHMIRLIVQFVLIYAGWWVYQKYKPATT